MPAATAAQDLFDHENQGYTEVLGGASYGFGGATAFAATGVGITQGYGAPDWRALAGVRLGAPASRPQPERLVVEKPVPTAVVKLDVGESDRDGDGVIDDDDRCPDTPGVIENRGCPDGDRDGDGVVDRLDNCPDTPGTPENFGCPDVQLAQLMATEIAIADNVYFEFDKSDILPRSEPLLNNVAAIIAAHPEVGRIRIVGHADARGTVEYNLDLSRRRAESVVDYLAARGIDRERLLAVGQGESDPLRSNATEEGMDVNRRVEFHLIDAPGFEAVAPDEPAEVPAAGQP